MPTPSILLLIDFGALAAEWPVSVYVVPTPDSTAASATENMLREGIHPADEFDAFAS